MQCRSWPRPGIGPVVLSSVRTCEALTRRRCRCSKGGRATSPSHGSSRNGAERRTLVIWLPDFSGTKEKMEPYLAELAAAGFVALGYDPYQHGERMIETLDELRARIQGQHPPPLLADPGPHRRRRDAGHRPGPSRRLGVGERVGMGGISAGGDASVAAAAVDERIEAVAAGIATPDWLRPGSFEPAGRARQGGPGRLPSAQPAHQPASLPAHPRRSASQNGALDRQVPPDGSVRFVDALRREVYAGCPERIEAVLHDGVAHAFEGRAVAGQPSPGSAGTYEVSRWGDRGDRLHRHPVTEKRCAVHPTPRASLRCAHAGATGCRRRRRSTVAASLPTTGGRWWATRRSIWWW